MQTLGAPEWEAWTPFSLPSGDICKDAESFATGNDCRATDDYTRLQSQNIIHERISDDVPFAFVVDTRSMTLLDELLCQPWPRP